VYVLGGGLHGLTSPSVDLLNEGIELALKKRKARERTSQLKSNASSSRTSSPTGSFFE